jgi:dolichyl-phosphate-mannose-protein mannosyltransferase
MLALEAAAVACAALLAVSWFARPPGLAPPGAWLLGLVGLVAMRLARGSAPQVALPSPETAACVAIAILFRLPALLHPWGWVNRDGAYGAFVTLHLLQGATPAPVFTEGANYQGTLKPHLAALLALGTGVHDLSWLMVAAGALLSLVFLVATMALARRIGGRTAALLAGLYLALGPKFLTTFSLNSVGQYVDVLALGGVALALLARVLATDARGSAARGAYLAIGVLLGAAFWQQPVALSYAAVAFAALGLRRATWRDPWTALVPVGAVLGALPVVLWNLRNGWGSADIMGRGLGEQADVLLRVARRTASVAFPVLAGLSPGHPWQHVPGVPLFAAALLPALLVAYVAIRRRSLGPSAPRPDLLPPLLLVACVALAWAVAAGKVYGRPRYLLPVMAATAVHFGVVAAWAWTRSRTATAAAVALVIAFNVTGTWPRLRESASVAAWYGALVRAVEEKGIRTGYADFQIAAPVTMFTSERVLLSSALGPTPAYESDAHAARVRSQGPDAFVLRPQDDPQPLADWLTAQGVTYQLAREPVPIFWALSRRVPVEEARAFVGGPAGETDE